MMVGQCTVSNMFDIGRVIQSANGIQPATGNSHQPTRVLGGGLKGRHYNSLPLSATQNATAFNSYVQLFLNKLLNMGAAANES